MKRRKLFSSTSDSPVRRKLFSKEAPEVRQYICMDCGYVIENLETASRQFCPKCGGTRFNIYSKVEKSSDTECDCKKEDKSEKCFTRKSLFSNDSFEKEFSEVNDNFEQALKDFSGKTLSNVEVIKNFSTTADDLIEKGFATKEDDGVKILDTAFLQSKMFSKLIVSVTKVLDLDPKIMNCETPKESVIDSIEEHNSLTPKGIILIKKAHNIPLVAPENKECEECNCIDSWAKDSGIVGDLKLEFGGKNMGVEKFTDILHNRYSDAPKGLIDYLISNGHIGINGNKVDILN